MHQAHLRVAITRPLGTGHLVRLPGRIHRRFLPLLIYAFYDYATFLSFSKRTVGRALSGCEREARRSIDHYLPLSLSSNATPPLSRLTDKSIATAKLPVGNSALSPFCICCIETFWRKQETMTIFLFSSLLVFTKVFLSSFRLYSFIFDFIVRDVRIFTCFILLPQLEEFGERRATFKIRIVKVVEAPNLLCFLKAEARWKVHGGSTAVIEQNATPHIDASCPSQPI